MTLLIGKTGALLCYNYNYFAIIITIHCFWGYFENRKLHSHSSGWLMASILHGDLLL